MRTLDKFEQLAYESTICCIAIFANLLNGDFQLVDVDMAPLPPDVMARYNARGLAVVGLIGVSEGPTTRTVLNEVLSDALNTSIVAEFQRLFGRALAQLEGSMMGDSLIFLERLGKLQDVRQEPRRIARKD